MGTIRYAYRLTLSTFFSFMINEAALWTLYLFSSFYGDQIALEYYYKREAYHKRLKKIYLI